MVSLVATWPLVGPDSDLDLVLEVEVEELIPPPKMMLRLQRCWWGEPSVEVSELFFLLPFGKLQRSSSQWDVDPTQAVETALVVSVHLWA